MLGVALPEANDRANPEQCQRSPAAESQARSVRVMVSVPSSVCQIQGNPERDFDSRRSGNRQIGTLEFIGSITDNDGVYPTRPGIETGSFDMKFDPARNTIPIDTYG